MDLSPIPMHDTFNQNDYDNKFYCCSGGKTERTAHPFVAFVTCFCPVCDLKADLDVAMQQVEEAEELVETTNEEYYRLVSIANKIAPEILL